jgi:signal transduction histidine kinase
VTALVLVIDPDPVLVRGLESLISEEIQAEVRAFSSLADARVAAFERPPDGLVCAHHPTSFPGLELARELSNIDAHLAVILSTHANEDDARAEAVGAFGPLRHLTKPVEPAELIAKLGAVLERRELVSQLETERAALQHRDQALKASRRRLERTAEELAITHSELATATERLVAAEELAAVGRVVGGIAHEISNQLALVGYAEAIKSRVTDPELIEFAEVIVAAQKRLASMVAEIHDFAEQAAYDHDGGAIEREPAELGLAVDEALAILAYDRDFRARNIERDWRARPLVALHRQKFCQVIINLISNAVLATEIGDTLVVTIDVDREVGEAVVQVIDRGVGMSRGVLERLGEPFFSTRGARGSGLGVGICMQIARDHGGSLQFESELDVGTTATVRLPLLEEASP